MQFFYSSGKSYSDVIKKVETSLKLILVNQILKWNRIILKHENPPSLFNLMTTTSQKEDYSHETCWKNAIC